MSTKLHYIRRASLIVVLAGLAACQAGREEGNDYFVRAEPIWPAGLEYAKNLTIGFRGVFEADETDPVHLNITGSTLYRIYLNGVFVGHGPARAGHGHYRVGVWDLIDHLQSGKNILAIEVAAYNVNSYYLLDQPAFLQAEVVSGGRALLATSGSNTDFTACRITGRVQKVPRYSFQRPFVEYYKLDAGSDKWRADLDVPWNDLVCTHAGEKQLVPRRIGYPEFIVRHPERSISSGEMRTGVKRDRYWKDRAVRNIGEQLGGFPEQELAVNPAIDLQEMESSTSQTFSADDAFQAPFALLEDQYRILDMGTNLTGFIGVDLELTGPARLYITFDEILNPEGDVDFKRLSCINAVTYALEPGSYTLESFEPYTFRYMKLILTDGNCTVKDVYLREYVNPDVEYALFESSDPRLDRIFEAGIETFRQNALDIFMDCPSRERAGWLCDSYFTARVASDVSGHTLIEKNFFENYLLPKHFEALPKGMLPMCYPADHYDGVFIPNWAMWFVMELREYLGRSNDTTLVHALQPRVAQLLQYFAPFENETGLLENLESWIFIEWSEANKFVQDVNYPTNMLYAATLEAAYTLYGEDRWKEKADAIRDTIRAQAFNGDFFIDNAVRNERGRLEVTDNTTEVCQYYAFYFDVATPETYPRLWKRLTEQFGPGRAEHDMWPSVHPANAFIGNYLRLELLSRHGLKAQLIGESVDFFDYMARETGTLWENITPRASCNHGFASHIVHVLYRDVLGIDSIDRLRKVITLRFPEHDLGSCMGQMPIGEELIQFDWRREGESIVYHVEVPAGYSVTMINDSGRELVQK